MKTINDYTEIEFNGFSNVDFEIILHDNEYFSVIIKNINKIAIDNVCTLTTQITEYYDDGTSWQLPDEQAYISPTIITKKIDNKKYKTILYQKELGFSSNGVTRKYKYIIDINTCENISIDALNNIADEYYIQRNIFNISYYSYADEYVKTFIKDNNDNIIDEFYTDDLYIKFKTFVGQPDKKYYLILNYNNKKQAIDFGFDNHDDDFEYVYSIHTDNHEIDVDKLINTCDEVGTQFYFNNSALFKIDDITHDIVLETTTINNSKFKNIQQIQKTLEDEYEYLAYHSPVYGYSNIGQSMFGSYMQYYKLSYINTADTDYDWNAFDFTPDWNNILSVKDNSFIIYNSINNTYNDIYEKIKNIQLDIDLSNELSNDYVVKFCGFIGLTKLFLNNNNYYNNSIYNIFNEKNIYLNLDDTNEFKSILEKYNLVFIPFGDALQYIELTSCNLDKKIEIYTTFYPVVHVRNRRVKLLNVGRNSDFNIIKNAVVGQIADYNSMNNINVEYSSFDAINKADFENELRMSLAQCEMIIMNMMTNFYRYDGGNQYCAFKYDDQYEFIDTDVINKCIYNPQMRTFDIMYIVHCPYGGGTLDRNENLYKDIELMKYSSSSKQNIIGIAQYGSASGGLYIDNNTTNTLLMQSLIQHFYEKNHCGTYSQFITDFNARAKTIRDAVINEIRKFAITFQNIIIDSNNITFSFDGHNSTNKEFLLKFNDKKTLINEIGKNDKFIKNPNDYFLNEDEDPCMFQIYFACLAQSNFIKNIYLEKKYEQNKCLQSYREEKQMRISVVDPDFGIEVVEKISVPAGFILSKITELFSTYFKKLFRDTTSFTDSQIRQFLQNDIENFYNNVELKSYNNDDEIPSSIQYDTNVYDIWKIFHRAIVPLFFSHSLKEINNIKENIDQNDDSKLDENQALNAELNRYINILNEIFIQTIIHIYHIYNLKSSISQLAGIKENEQNKIWDLIFSIIPTSWPHAKVLSNGLNHENFMNRAFLT